MAGWQQIGRGLNQAGGAIAHGIYRRNYRKREEEEEERKRQTAIKLLEASTSGEDKDEELREKGREYIRMGGSMQDARGRYRAALGQKKTKEAEAEAPFKLQPLTEKGKPAGGKPPSYVTQQLIKETQRRATQKKAAEELQGRQERRQSGVDQGMTGKKLEYYTSRPKITEAALGRLTGGMREKPPKAPDITTDVRAKFKGQVDAYITSPQGDQEVNAKALEWAGLTPQEMVPPVLNLDQDPSAVLYNQQLDTYRKNANKLKAAKARVISNMKSNAVVDAIVNNPKGVMPEDSKDLEAALMEQAKELEREIRDLMRELRQ